MFKIGAQASSEEKYKAIFDSVDDALFVHDPETGAILEVNRKMTELYGYKGDEALAITVGDISSGRTPYTQEKALDKIRTAAKKGALDFKWHCKDKFGRLFWTEVNLKSAVVNDKVNVIAAVRDITEQKLFEQKLRERESRFRALSEASSGGIAIHVKGIIIDCNQKLADMTGYSLEELIGMDGLDLAPPAWRDFIKEKIITKNDKPYDTEGLRKDGTIFPVEITGKVISYNSLKARVAEFRDITERKHAENALRESEEKFHSLFDNSLDGIMLTSTDGSIISANGEMCRILGMTEEEIIRAGRQGIAFFDEDMEKALEERRRTGRFRGELFYRKKDGSRIPVEVSSGTFIDKSGRVLTSMSVRDITERKQVDEELNKYRQRLEELVKGRTVELEEKNRKLREEVDQREKAEAEKRKVEAQLAQAQRIEAIDRFACGIAHDLNNILYPIIINLEELIDEEREGSIHHEILTQTLRAAYRQRDLVKKILSFSRRSERANQPVRVRPLLEETLSFLRASLPSTISIQENIHVLTDVIMGDPVQIEQVIMNLCKNAADALESERGVIEIELANVHMGPMYSLHDMKAGDYLKLMVKDTGMGMSPEVVDRIFEPFFTKKDIGKGTGLGLPVVHGIVKSHGGTVTVESGEGRGSAFTVYLPISHVELPTQTPDAESTPSVQGKESILLVDDEELILSSLQRTLELSGYRVTALKNGQEALKEFKENPEGFDLVITDLTMPGMTGLDLSRKLQEKRPGLPIVLCTGFNDVISQQEAKSFGIKKLLLKPIGTVELKKVVQLALEH